MKAKDILLKAAALITGSRQQEHGDMRENFTRVACLWNAYLLAKYGTRVGIQSEDVPMMLIDLKRARMMGNPKSEDNYTDTCGYASLAGEMATDDLKR